MNEVPEWDTLVEAVQATIKNFKGNSVEELINEIAKAAGRRFEGNALPREIKHPW